MSARFVTLTLCAGLVLAGCEKQETKATRLPVADVTRGDIAVRVQATGTVETIDPVEIKSKAGGAITQLPVEVGSKIAAKALLAQIDPRDVKNRFDQAVADDVVTYTTLYRVLRDQARKDTLFAKHVITASEHDSTLSTVRSAESDMVESRSALDLARQGLEDASIESPIAGTIVARPVSIGSIVTAATGQATGTSLMTVADLSRVRMRVTIDEVEMGNVRVGQTTSVAVDAFADRTFNGVIEKVEPQAVVTQGVTFFPVLITIDNREGLLMPGMSGEVTIKAADLSNVVQLPIDAVRATNELAPIARMFVLPVDSIISQMRPDLISVEGATAIPGHYVVVQKSDSTYEMRLVKLGPTDLRVQQVLDGVQPGDKVVLLGSVMTTRPVKAPTLALADGLRRGSVNALTPRAPSGKPGAGSPGATPAGARKAPSITTPKSEMAKANTPGGVTAGVPGKP